jgi:hypothetical protein
VSRRCARTSDGGRWHRAAPATIDVDNQHLVVVQRHYEPVQQDQAIVDGSMYVLEPPPYRR